MLGVLIALLSAFSFSLSDVTVRRGVTRAPVAYGAIVTVLMGVPLFLVACTVTGQIFEVGELSALSYVLLGSAGVIHYVVGRYFNYAAIQAIGAARTGPIHTLGLPYSVVIAFLFLDEGITSGMVAGIVLIMVGPVIMVERRQKAVVATVTDPIAPAAEPPGFQLRQTEGYVFAIIAAMSYGTSPVLIRSALEGESGVSLLGGLVSYIAASVLLLVSLLLPARRHLAKALEPASIRVFAAPGFFVFMAQLFRFVALSLASVAVVATLLRFTTIFTLVMSWIINRDLEKITSRVVIGVTISLVGAVLLVLSS
jgi:drug/metabolite transporter (DMT)-like permease